jgi:hypothetical protein
MTSVIARAAVAPILANPTIRAEQVTQLVLGETAGILERSGEWRRISTNGDHYQGWVNSGYLLEVEDPAADDWRKSAIGWSEGAAVRIDGSQIALPLRARVGLEGDVVRLPTGLTARVISGCVRPMAETVRAARAKAPERWAYRYFLGSPYQWGGVTPWGVDCSGLVQTTFAARGVQLPRDSAQQVDHGTDVAPEAIRPGDLLFFRGETSAGITHVAFAGEGDTLVHSTLACGGVLVEPCHPGTRAAGLWERLVAVRRIKE